MEDEDGIGLILARATELKLKITDCIDDASSAGDGDGDVRNSGGAGSSPGDGREGESSGNEDDNSDSGLEEEEDEEAEWLLHIRDALESLESQLAALQNLRQRQQFEKQMALSEIDYSRKVLLEKLKEYKGKDFEVIHETSAFAGESVDYDAHLLLPPYPIRPPISTVSENGYLPRIPSKQRSERNGLASSNAKDEAHKNTEPESSGGHGLIRFVGSFVKFVLPIIGVISIVSASGYGIEIRKRGVSLKLLGFLQPQGSRDKRLSSVQCPPGKVLVMEGDEEARCLVKERVEVPFDSVVAKRDVAYGYG